MASTGRCAVTGANGFVGARIVAELVERGYDVIALAGADLDSESLAGLPVEVRDGIDVRDPAAVRAGLAGATTVVHAAATYSFWAPDRRDIYRVNVDGTRRVLDAARALGITRFVHVSSAATLSPSLENADDARLPGDGEGTLDLRRFRGHYKASKAMAEALALREAAQGLPVVIVQPTTVIGPGDRRPTPSGSMIVHYLNGHMKVYVEMRQNVVDVRDVARGVALALERGRPGARYVLGGDNLPMRAVLEILAELTGISAPRIPLPLSLLNAGGVVNELIADRVTHRMPTVCREQALHARDSRYFSSEQARRELGYEARPAGAALAAAVRFFATEGHCDPEAARRILRRPQLEESLPGP